MHTNSKNNMSIEALPMPTVDTITSSKYSVMMSNVTTISVNQLPIELKILDNRIGSEYPLPEPATSGSAAIDLRAMIDKELILYPGFTELVPSGISVNIQNPNFCMVIIPRSGMGHNLGLVLGNGTGLIDSDYQGEIKISLFNRGIDPVRIKPGDRVAQAFILPVFQPKFKIVTEFSNNSARGHGGFGHTGHI